MGLLKLTSRTGFGTRRATDQKPNSTDGLLESTGSTTGSSSSSSATKVSMPMTPPDQLSEDEVDASAAATTGATSAAHRTPAPKKRSLRKGSKRGEGGKKDKKDKKNKKDKEDKKERVASKRRKSVRIAQILRGVESDDGGTPAGEARGGGERRDQAGQRPARLKLTLNGVSGRSEGAKVKAAQ